MEFYLKLEPKDGRQLDSTEPAPVRLADGAVFTIETDVEKWIALFKFLEAWADAHSDVFAAVSTIKKLLAQQKILWIIRALYTFILRTWWFDWSY